MIMNYKNLGNSGIMVSELCLGTMTFGKGSWNIGSVSQEDANELVQYAIDHGINFFDTADIYSSGESEKVLGNAIKAAGVNRDSVIIATKARSRMSDEVNDIGLSRHHLLTSVEKSLKRLQTDYIDLYQVHSWDPLTPIEETMQALNDLVRWGKVRYIGASNYAAWQLSKANHVAEKHGWNKFITLQGYYSLAGRGIENEIVPLCMDQNIGILPWSPLAGGMLSGKYRKDKPFPKDTRLSGRLKGFIPIDEEKLYEILEVLDEISERHNVPVASVALAWLRFRDQVSSVIIGARNMKQLEENIQAGELELEPEEVDRLEEASRTQLPYPQWMLEMQVKNRFAENIKVVKH
jgi:aryl-alcohol dehydrogenase-like predicted oxidoreductase